MTKAYIVREIHDYDQFSIVGVCSSRELAEKLKQKNENSWNLKDCEITSEMWDKMLMYVFRKDPSVKNIEEKMIEIYPEYLVSDITRACREHMNCSYISTVIEEINLFTNNTDIEAYGINPGTGFGREKHLH